MGNELFGIVYDVMRRRNSVSAGRKNPPLNKTQLLIVASKHSNNILNVSHVIDRPMLRIHNVLSNYPRK